VCSTDELEDDVNASDLGDLIECDGLVGAALAKSFVVLARSRDGNHVRAQRVRDLDRGDADPAGRAGYQDSFAGIQMSLGHERVVGGCEGFGKSSRLIPTDVIRDEEQMFTRYETVGRLGAATNDGADSSPEERFVYPFTDGTHDTGEFHTGHVRGPALGGGVVAVALHEVGRVDPGTADRDDDVVGAGIGGLALLEFEVPIVDDDAAHPCSLRRAALHDRPLVSRNDHL
jgi:hypothetical protein